MKYILALLILSTLPLQIFAQSDKKELPSDVRRWAEKMPEAPFDVIKYLQENLEYPKDASDEGIEGRVAVQFVVAENGSITNIRVFKPIHPSLDKEAIRVVSKMPKWTPGEHEGKPVKVLYTLPISFTL